MEIDSLTESLRVHPVFLIGLYILSMALGAFFGQTLFASLVTIIGLSMIPASIIWMFIALIIMTLGISASFEVSGDAE